MTNTTAHDAHATIAHTAQRRAELAGTNHAGQIAWTCRRCHAEYDVGHERFLSPAFDSLCCECFRSGHR
ncbi:hypothetical protein QSJ18_18290 [Gordonia sp. ABSL1-1]|uniref:hypothetical protein n=1 Tax=Gordonia sp. ABSL1-1 TaxID=3053923 RepID=UPI002572615E|nr:hypothetical protein [Gordonia sp. ABSL1-1]MDL9938700.1 hypothetical protein [Gordonia sp. ABSL1-1]